MTATPPRKLRVLARRFVIVPVLIAGLMTTVFPASANKWDDSTSASSGGGYAWGQSGYTGNGRKVR